MYESSRFPGNRIMNQNTLKCLTYGSLLLIALVYGSLWGIYQNNDIDNAWSTAWIYNFIRHGETRDVIFCEGDPNYWGVRFFSHIYCRIYGGLLTLLGFTKNNVHLVSGGMTIAGVICWKMAAERILENSRQVMAFAVMLTLAGVTVAAANKARSDAMVFACTGLMLLLATRKQYFGAALTACIAVETHPIGITAFCYLGAWLLCFDRECLTQTGWRRSAALIAGCLCGTALYLFLHHDELGALRAMGANAESGGNFLVAHFFGRASFPWRYWPDLALFAIALAGHFRVFGYRKPFFLLTVMFLIGVSLILRRGNFHYALFCYPAFLLLTVNLAGHLGDKILLAVWLGWIGLMLPQYLYLGWRNWPGRDFPDYISRLQKLDLPRAATIYGMPNDYYALMDHSGFRTFRLQDKEHVAWLIEHVDTIYAQPDFKCDLAYDPGRWHLEKRAEFSLKSGGVIRIWHVMQAPAAPLQQPNTK